MTAEQALGRLQDLCSKSEYSTGQVERRLMRWSQTDRRNGNPGFTAEQMEGIVAALVEERFVDNARFAGAYVRDKARFSKWGRTKIRYNLLQLGVAERLISAALAENAELFGDEVLAELIGKKWKTLKDGQPLEIRKQKVIRFALGRGFEFAQILPLVNRLR